MIMDEKESKMKISVFDYSIENHFKAMDKISKLCGEDDDSETVSLDNVDIQRLSSSITFLREWRWFIYEEKVVRFASEMKCHQSVANFCSISLPQFSSTTVPTVHQGGEPGGSTSQECSKDFVMYVGGSVWALDWCPRIHKRSESPAKLEFVAIAAHPPESQYHNIGLPLTGRGVVQIWCILNFSVHEESEHSSRKPKKPKQGCQQSQSRDDKGGDQKRPRGRPRKEKVEPQTDDTTKENPTEIKRPRGRPRKKQIEESCDDEAMVLTKFKRKKERPRKKTMTEPFAGPDDRNEHLQPLAIEYPEGLPEVPATDEASGTAEEQPKSIRKVQKHKNNGNKHARPLSIEYPAGFPELPATDEASRIAEERPKSFRKGRKCKHNSDEHAQLLAIEYPEDVSELPSTNEACGTSKEQPESITKGRKCKSSSKEPSTCNLSSNTKERKRSRRKEVPATDEASGTAEEQPKSIRKGRKCKNNGNKHARPLSIEYPAGFPELPATDEASQIAEERPKSIRKGRKYKHNSDEHAQLLAIEYPEDVSELPSTNEASGTSKEQPESIIKGRKCKSSSKEPPTCNLSSNTKKRKRSRRKEVVQIDPNLGTFSALVPQNEEGDSLNLEHKIHENAGNFYVANDCPTYTVSADMSSGPWSTHEDVALPRLMLCLAHDGKVAWDVKWRPVASDFKCKHLMGYLAVVLGNGALEVWDVPLPCVIKCIYSSSNKEGTDPRFVKMEPVFRCSRLNCGERQSLPWVVEWSTSYPHDYLIAGCHDGTVALWRFLPAGPSGDTRPLLCFSADTVPIRALAWAPVSRDQENVNVIVTAGHDGLKFWDIRDPFRPLWVLHPAPKFIYGLDWIPDPRCLVLTFDDGAVRLLSLTKAAYDAPVNGKPSIGPKQTGLHMLNTSSFAIWSIQISRVTGMGAYCGADGTVHRFQLTTKAVDKDPSRNRTPHFRCGSLSEEESAIVVNIPPLNATLPWSKPVTGDNPRTMKGLLCMSNQAKTTKDQKGQASDSQPLALCYGDESDNTHGCVETPEASKNKRTVSKFGGGKKAENALALTCGNNRGDGLEKEITSEAVANAVEHFPSKAVAIHRVRWNMNIGSERWLCYGGAAGIVRCQEIVMTDTDRYLASKK